MIVRPFGIKKITKSQKNNEKNGKKVIEPRKKCRTKPKILMKIQEKKLTTRKKFRRHQKQPDKNDEIRLITGSFDQI